MCLRVVSCYFPTVTDGRAIVLGGSGALGGVIARRLSAAGMRVGLTFHRGEARARALEAELGCVVAPLDATRPGDVERAIDALVTALGGPPDALVHAIAIASTVSPARFDRVQEVDDAGWDRLMAVNVKSAFFAVKHAAPLMRGRGGNVVLLGSIDGEKSVPTTAPYAVSKAALAGIARALAKELGPSNVRVNVVAPGILEGGISALVPEEVRAEYLKHSGAKRYGTFAEIAEVVAWLAQSNTYVTGRSILLDGGV